MAGGAGSGQHINGERGGPVLVPLLVPRALSCSCREPRTAGGPHAAAGRASVTSPRRRGSWAPQNPQLRDARVNRVATQRRGGGFFEVLRCVVGVREGVRWWEFA